MGRLQRFWSEGVWQQIAVIVGALVLCGCCGLVVGGGVLAGVGLFVPASSTTTYGVIYGPTTSTGTQIVSGSTVGPSPTVVSTRSTTATRTVVPKATATHSPARATPVATPSGPPELGAPLADFTAAYGPIISHGIGGSDNFYADKAQTIIVNVGFTNGLASTISVLGPNSWGNAETFAACYVYLSPDATQFNRAGTYTDYHSSLGEEIINNVGDGTCQVFLAGS
jgi:hypothetical protein